MAILFQNASEVQGQAQSQCLSSSTENLCSRPYEVCVHTIPKRADPPHYPQIPAR